MQTIMPDPQPTAADLLAKVAEVRGMIQALTTRHKPPQGTAAAATYKGQLAGRVGELLPDLNLTERLELLGVMDPDDMRASLAWLAGTFPQMFDFALVRDRGLVARLGGRLGLALAEEDEPYCRACGSPVGIFRGHGDGWHHYRGEGTTASPVELFDAGHPADVGWHLAGAR